MQDCGVFIRVQKVTVPCSSTRKDKETTTTKQWIWAFSCFDAITKMRKEKERKLTLLLNKKPRTYMHVIGGASAKEAFLLKHHAWIYFRPDDCESADQGILALLRHRSFWGTEYRYSYSRTVVVILPETDTSQLQIQVIVPVSHFSTQNPHQGKHFQFSDHKPVCWQSSDSLRSAVEPVRRKNCGFSVFAENETRNEILKKFLRSRECFCKVTE